MDPRNSIRNGFAHGNSIRKGFALSTQMPAQAVLPFTLSYGAYSAIYNALSFVMASMGASTVYFFFHAAMMPQLERLLCIRCSSGNCCAHVAKVL